MTNEIPTLSSSDTGLTTWKNGRLEPCTLAEFICGLRRHAGWADQEFGIRSDAAAHLGQRLNAAADALERHGLAQRQSHIVEAMKKCAFYDFDSVEMVECKWALWQDILNALGNSVEPVRDATDNCSCSPRYRPDCAYMKGGYCIEPVRDASCESGVRSGNAGAFLSVALQIIHACGGDPKRADEAAHIIASHIAPLPGNAGGVETAEMLQRCMDMLADVPGATLEDKLTKYIGEYMALQLRASPAVLEPTPAAWRNPNTSINPVVLAHQKEDMLPEIAACYSIPLYAASKTSAVLEPVTVEALTARIQKAMEEWEDELEAVETQTCAEHIARALIGHPANNRASDA